MKCKCGSNEFYARQRIVREIVVDGDGKHVEECDVLKIEALFGPFTCTKCGKTHQSLSDATTLNS